MYLDWTYMVFVVPALILALWAQANVSYTFSKYSKYASKRGMTGSEAARQLLNSCGIHHVTIEHTGGKLSDHFDPKANIIRLSPDVYSKSSVAAIGVACHEAGHAIQHNESYFPIKLRNAIIPVAKIGSYAAFPLAFLGLYMRSQFMVDFGILLFSAVVLFQIITLPVEFDASNRAVKYLAGTNIIEPAELKGIKKVLHSAAMTYVAAMATSVMNLLRLLVLSNSNRRRN